MSAVTVSCLMPSGSANSGRGGRPGPNVSDMTPARLLPSTGWAWSGSTAQVVGTHR